MNATISFWRRRNVAPCMSTGGVEFSSVPTKEQKPMEVRSGDVGNPLLVAPEDVETPTTLDAAPAPAPGGTLSRAVVALVRCMVGPAALYIPKGFSDAGIGGSLVCIVVANVLFALGISRLVDCWRHARDEGLDTAHGIQGLARRFAGPRCDVLVRFCVAAMQCGDCVTYFIFVAENAGDLLGSRAPSLAILIAAMAVFEAPLSLTTKLQKLHFLNALGNALVAFALVVVAAYALKTLAREGPRADVTYGFAPLGSTLTFAGITVFAFEGTAPIVVPVCDATASKHRGRMTALTVATVASVAAAYACFGIVCYLAFGDEVNVIASQSLPSTPWPGGAVRGVYVVVVLLTFPLQLFPVTDMFDASGERPRAAAASRVGLVFFLAALAVAFEHKLDHVVSLLGALACAPLGLIVGPWMHLSIAASTRDRALDWLSIAAGSAIAVATTANAVATWRSASS